MLCTPTPSFTASITLPCVSAPVVKPAARTAASTWSRRACSRRSASRAAASAVGGGCARSSRASLKKSSSTCRAARDALPHKSGEVRCRLQPAPSVATVRTHLRPGRGVMQPEPAARRAHSGLEVARFPEIHVSHVTSTVQPPAWRRIRADRDGRRRGSRPERTANRDGVHTGTGTCAPRKARRGGRRLRSPAPCTSSWRARWRTSGRATAASPARRRRRRAPRTPARARGRGRRSGRRRRSAGARAPCVVAPWYASGSRRREVARPASSCEREERSWPIGSDSAHDAAWSPRRRPPRQGRLDARRRRCGPRSELLDRGRARARR